MKHLLFLILLFPLFVKSQTKLQVVQDSVQVMNGELVIRNNSRNVSGYLYNKGNGVTEFRPGNLQNSKGIQFRVGAPGYPKAGENSYSSNAFVNAHLNVWRNGIYQYKDSADGVLIDSVAGKIYFNPALASGDRVYIETVGVDLLQNNIFGFFTNLVQLKAGLVDNNDYTFTLRWATNQNTLTQKPRVIGLGSSTLAGYALSAPNRLGDKISAWLSANTTSPTWINLAVGGYYSGNVLPTSMGGEAGHNIDSAIKANPDFIFVSLPSNDPSAGLTVAQTMNNLRTIDAIAGANGIPVFFETSQPRTSYTADQQTQLKILADSIRAAWPDRYVEGFKDVVDATAATSAVIKPEYDNGDGIHLNSAGNQFIANSLFARWNGYFKSIVGVTKYVVQTSTDQANWTNFDVIIGSDSVKKTYSRQDNLQRYFRVYAVYNNGQASTVSNTSKINLLQLNYTGKGSRVLVDLGGDGVNTKNGSGAADGRPVPVGGAFGNCWNNWYGDGSSGKGFIDGSALTNLKAANGIPTGMSVKIIGSPYGSYVNNPTNGLNYNGFETASVNDYPMEAIYDNMFLNSSINPNGVTLRISGLTPAKNYSIKLWGARVDNSTTPRILETKLGTQTWLDAVNIDTRYSSSDAPNYDNAIVYNVTGTDQVDINARVGTGSSFAHISLIDIDTVAAGGQGGGSPTITMNDVSVTLPQSSVQLTPTITANGATITSYEWSKVNGPSDLTLSSPTGASTTASALTNGIYTYKIKITTSTGYSTSKNFKIIVYPDNQGKKTLRTYFSQTQQLPIPGWLNAYGGVTGNNLSFTDATTGWTIDNGGNTTAYWNPYGNNSADDAGQSTGNNSGVVPDLALKNYWFNSSAPYVSGTNNIVVSGLNPAKTYVIKMLGSRSNTVGQPRYAAWHINNGAEILQNAWGNTSNMYTSGSVSPDANGKIYIGVYSPSNQGTYGAFSYINALIIQEN